IRGRASDQVLSRFVLGINESALDKPIVMIFDTMEEVLLRAGSLERWKEMLRQLHLACPSVRLIFSGRYHVEQKSPGFSAAFFGLKTVRVREFDDAEARTYLSKLRGIADQELVQEAVRLSGGLPFKLALFADVLQERLDLTAEELRAYRDPDLLYL